MNTTTAQNRNLAKVLRTGTITLVEHLATRTQIEVRADVHTRNNGGDIIHTRKGRTHLFIVGHESGRVAYHANPGRQFGLMVDSPTVTKLVRNIADTIATI